VLDGMKDNLKYREGMLDFEEDKGQAEIHKMILKRQA
jgi:hypothetical protein